MVPVKQLKSVKRLLALLFYIAYILIGRLHPSAPHRRRSPFLSVYPYSNTRVRRNPAPRCESCTPLFADAWASV
jgi:hypothetical protein